MELYNQTIERDIIAYLQDQTAPVSLAELEKALALGRDEAADGATMLNNSPLYQKIGRAHV